MEYLTLSITNNSRIRSCCIDSCAVLGAETGTSKTKTGWKLLTDTVYSVCTKNTVLLINYFFIVSGFAASLLWLLLKINGLFPTQGNKTMYWLHSNKINQLVPSLIELISRSGNSKLLFFSITEHTMANAIAPLA